ncbi:MerR family transcriptional regulator [Clostridium sp. D2Q-14]|uniref:helix-turn-helix domain-containing protein n=1 Tax=Anaeromonas gelatinilytica TaxID=2683194 RepID=UPI00193BC829|nr:helix-turn-helix domain-containing protein [Anaeromonas gelatinilytica]MBS4536261.1 MerR family transcriptional regulator [Anaeromonas gelatinilytica]
MSKKKLSISEVSNLLGYENHVLRYYEKEFELNIPRNEVNHRYYTDVEIKLLKQIKKLQEQGYSNKQIKLILKSPDLIKDSKNETCATVMINETNNSSSLNSESNDIINNIEKETIILGELKEEIINLIKKQFDKDKDIIMSENAKLKLKLKEKSYEIVRLKEIINDLENKKILFFKRKKK